MPPLSVLSLNLSTYCYVCIALHAGNVSEFRPRLNHANARVCCHPLFLLEAMANLYVAFKSTRFVWCAVRLCVTTRCPAWASLRQPRTASDRAEGPSEQKRARAVHGSQQLSEDGGGAAVEAAAHNDSAATRMRQTSAPVCRAYYKLKELGSRELVAFSDCSVAIDVGADFRCSMQCAIISTLQYCDL
eukprot:6176954-Pleurochrysis_carterae.AAC.2